MKNNTKTILFSWLLLFLIILVSVLCFFHKIRPIVIDFAINEAEGNSLLAAENAISDVIGDSITYDKISHVSRDENNRFTGVELDTKELNIIKSDIYREINKKNIASNFEKFKIPLGTLLCFDYFSDIGPKLSFAVQFYKGTKISFKSSFKQAGINQVLHQIIINVIVSGKIVTLGKSKGFTKQTSAIVAQTVIVGVVPQYYTEFANGVETSLTKK